MSSLYNFAKVKVLVVGDVMLDKYLWGNVTRISPEAPVPVVNLKETTFRVGGAANVAANIVGLGATVYLVGLTGCDAEGEIFRKTLKSAGVSAEYLYGSEQRVTTTKTRIIAHNQQIVRLDQESTQSLSAEDDKEIWEIINKVVTQADIIVISDYAKGLLSPMLLKRLIRFANENRKLIVIDPKGRDYSKYRNATIITPNKFEMADACGCKADDLTQITEAGRKMLETLNLRALIVTRGEEGVLLIEKEQKPFRQEAVARTVFDVTGAGDTFISALAIVLGAGGDLVEAVEVANLGAGLAVEQLGTTIIDFAALTQVLEERVGNDGS